MLSRAKELAGCPEPPHPDFPPYLDSFLDAVAQVAATPR
jgi:hypothetical protein